MRRTTQLNMNMKRSTRWPLHRIQMLKVCLQLMVPMDQECVSAPRQLSLQHHSTALTKKTAETMTKMKMIQNSFQQSYNSIRLLAFYICGAESMRKLIKYYFKNYMHKSINIIACRNLLPIHQYKTTTIKRDLNIIAVFRVFQDKPPIKWLIFLSEK